MRLFKNKYLHVLHYHVLPPSSARPGPPTPRKTPEEHPAELLGQRWAKPCHWESLGRWVLHPGRGRASPQGRASPRPPRCCAAASHGTGSDGARSPSPPAGFEHPGKALPSSAILQRRRRRTSPNFHFPASGAENPSIHRQKGPLRTPSCHSGDGVGTR